MDSKKRNEIETMTSIATTMNITTNPIQEKNENKIKNMVSLTTPLNIHNIYKQVLLMRENATTQNEITETITNLTFLMNKSMEYETYELAGSIMEQLGYLLLQENRRDEAINILEQLNYTHCLGRNIICYDNQINQQQNATKNNNIVHVYQNIISNDSILNQLKMAFHQNSPYWTEHNYPCGYFSYSHPISTTTTTTTTTRNDDKKNHLIEQFANYIQDIISIKFPKVKTAKVVEWWAHRRPHCHSHQMHFDSDNEGIGTVRNPICSTVFYLTPEGIGGPTLVTTQTLQSQTLAKNGWLIFPNENSLGVFDGKYLHGVIPGKGVTNVANRVSNKNGVDTSSSLPPRRITLMIAFWDSIEIRSNNAKPGASRMFPSPTTITSSDGDDGGKYTWPTLLKPVNQQLFTDMYEKYDVSKEEVPMIEVAGPIWEPLIDNNRNNKEGSSSGPMPRYDDCFQYPVM